MQENDEQKGAQLKSVMRSIDNQVRQLPCSGMSGSTANIMQLFKKKIIVANIGDSRSTMFFRKKGS